MNTTATRHLRWMVPAIAALAVLCAWFSLFYDTPGAPYGYESVRGELVQIEGHGLYAYDSVSIAAQAHGNDLIMLVVGVPLLLVSGWLAARGSRRGSRRGSSAAALRGQLLLTGTIAYFLYTGMSMSMLSAYNSLFLAYVALFGISLYAFILCMMSVDLGALPGRFGDRLPVKWIAALLFVVGGFLTLAWLMRILAPMAQGAWPPLEGTTTLVIQAMDLVLIAPACILGGVLLLRRTAWGYLLSSVMVLKAITMGLAVSAMGINMSLQGVPDSLGILVPFLTITALNLVAAVVILKSIK